MRIFIALDIDEGIRERIARFMEGVRGFAPEVRWVRSDSLHITLKFIGEKPEEWVEGIKTALSGIKSEAFELSFRGYGFFPTINSARVFWLGISAPAQLAGLASIIDEKVAALGISKENHVYSPHLTLARGGSGAPSWRKGDKPNQNFQKLQEKLRALPTPEFGTMTAREFFLYESQLLRGGARYTKIAGFALDQHQQRPL